MSQDNDTNPQLIARNPNYKDQPYAGNMQILVVGVHGTNNGPDQVRDVTNRIGASLDKITKGEVMVDTTFSWQDRSGTFNKPHDREAASKEFANHVIGLIDEGLRTGQIDRNKPLIVAPAGFSHGGNVAMQGVDEISEYMKNKGLNGGIHMITMSTPAYNDNGRESPAAASRAVTADGMTFEHIHFTVKGDGVVPAAFGNNTYVNGRGGNTRNEPMAAVSGWNGVDNHGAPQNSETHMKIIQEKVQGHFHNLAYGMKIAESTDGQQTVASAPTSAQNAPQADAFNRDPVVQQVYSSLGRTMPDTPRENLNPALVADISTAVYQQSKGNNTVGDIAFSNDRNTAFIAQGGKRLDDETAYPMRADVSNVNNRTFEQAWQQTSNAKQESQNNSMIAANEPEKQQSVAMSRNA